jgi:hypothetical protein
VRVPPIPAELVKIHLRNNRNSAGNWNDFTEHRTRVTELASAGAGGDAGSLALLGAGNCNDVDLPALAARFREIHLVDVDTEAVTAARERQPATVAAALTVHAPVDLSGALPRLAGFRSKPPSPAQLAELPDSCTNNVLGALPRTFDTVVSACILSQIMHGCRLALGTAPQLKPIANALTIGHLRALVRLTRPGGTALFITDVVSSETYPLDELWGERPPLELLDHLEQTDNLFSGVGPSYVRRLLARDPVIAPLIATPRIIEPWRWRLGPKITLLAYALVLARRA